MAVRETSFDPGRLQGAGDGDPQPNVQVTPGYHPSHLHKDTASTSTVRQPYPSLSLPLHDSAANLGNAAMRPGGTGRPRPGTSLWANSRALATAWPAGVVVEDDVGLSRLLQSAPGPGPPNPPVPRGSTGSHTGRPGRPRTQTRHLSAGRGSAGTPGCR